MKYSERTTHIKHIMHLHNIIHFVGYVEVPHTSLKSGLTVSSTVVPLPFQPIAFYLTSSQQSYTVCFFGGLNLTDIISWYVVDKNLCAAKDMWTRDLLHCAEKEVWHFDAEFLSFNASVCNLYETMHPLLKHSFVIFISWNAVCVCISKLLNSSRVIPSFAWWRTVFRSRLCLGLAWR